MRKLTSLPLVVVSLGATAASSYGVTFGQIDDFEDGTVMNWIVAPLGVTHPAPPENRLGGPGGAEDNYMHLTAVGGVSAGSRMAVLNGAQWSGNYVAAGVDLITMHVNNFSDSDLQLRILFERVVGGGVTDMATTTSSVLVPAHSGWMAASFQVGVGDLTTLLGTANTAVSDATFIRLFHNPSATFPGPPVVAQLGVDNIQAVPEPATLAFGAAGLAALVRRRRR